MAFYFLVYSLGLKPGRKDGYGGSITPGSWPLGCRVFVEKHIPWLPAGPCAQDLPMEDEFLSVCRYNCLLFRAGSLRHAPRGTSILLPVTDASPGQGQEPLLDSVPVPGVLAVPMFSAANGIVMI